MQSEITSSKVIVPILLSYLPKTKNILDINSQNGEWLYQFYIHKVNITGTSNNTNNKKLIVDKSNIIYSSNILDISTKKKYDLVLLRQCDEFLLNKKSIKKLTLLSDKVFIVLPFYTDSKKLNVNSFYASLFTTFNYHVNDLRCSIWYDDRIQMKYKQSSFLFIKNETFNENIVKKNTLFPLDTVHPLILKKYDHFYDLNNNNFDILDKLNKAKTALNMLENRLTKIENSVGWKFIKKFQYLVNKNLLLRFFYNYFYKKFK